MFNCSILVPRNTGPRPHRISATALAPREDSNPGCGWCGSLPVGRLNGKGQQEVHRILGLCNNVDIYKEVMMMLMTMVVLTADHNNDSNMVKMSAPTPGRGWAKPLASNILAVLTITLHCS